MLSKSVFLIIAILMGMKWCFIVVLICISLIANWPFLYIFFRWDQGFKAYVTAAETVEVQM